MYALFGKLYISHTDVLNEIKTHTHTHTRAEQ